MPSSGSSPNYAHTISTACKNILYGYNFKTKSNIRLAASLAFHLNTFMLSFQPTYITNNKPTSHKPQATKRKTLFVYKHTL